MSALTTFRASARKLRPTRQHRPVLWENMLGTVYARSLATGAVEYFDYDYAQAIAHIGAHEDVRVHRLSKDGYYDLSGTEIPRGKLVWFARAERTQ